MVLGEDWGDRRAPRGGVGGWLSLGGGGKGNSSRALGSLPGRGNAAAPARCLQTVGECTAAAFLPFAIKRKDFYFF